MTVTSINFNKIFPAHAMLHANTETESPRNTIHIKWQLYWPL